MRQQLVPEGQAGRRFRRRLWQAGVNEDDRAIPFERPTPDDLVHMLVSEGVADDHQPVGPLQLCLELGECGQEGAFGSKLSA